MRADTDNPPEGRHVLLVEDDRIAATTLKAYLESLGFSVSHHARGDTVMDAFVSESCSLVLLDLMLPGVDGLSLCRAIRSQSAVPIILITARTTEDDVIRGLECGADDYIRKPYSPREVMARVQSLLRRAAARPQATDRLSVGAISLDPRHRQAGIAGRDLNLTATEFDLLNVFMRAPGRVYTRTQLIDAVLGQLSEAGTRTIDTHVYNLRRKLNLPASEAGSIVAARGVGYRMLAQEQERDFP